MAERKMIQVDKDVAERLKEVYPDMSWTSILRLLLETNQPSGKGMKGTVNQAPINQSTIQASIKETPIKQLPIQDQFATIKDLSTLKEKFSTALSDIISQNNLKYIKK
jgi:hypothetical protein